MEFPQCDFWYCWSGNTECLGALALPLPGEILLKNTWSCGVNGSYLWNFKKVNTQDNMPHNTVEEESLVGLGLSLTRSLSSVNWVFFCGGFTYTEYSVHLCSPQFQDHHLGKSWHILVFGKACHVVYYLQLACSEYLIFLSSMSSYLEVDGNWVVSERWKSCHRLDNTEVAKNHETWAPSFLQALGFQGYFSFHSYMFLMTPCK